MTSARPTNKWMEPGTILAIAGVGMVAFGSYRDFQNDSVDRLNALRTRVAIAEVRIAGLNSRLDRVSDGLQTHIAKDRD